MDVSRDVQASSSSPTDEAAQQDFALVIGVDHYPRFRSLRGAIEDATRFDAWVRACEGGGVLPEHARLILSTASPAAPLQDHVDEELLELMDTADGLGGGRRLYVYFSGHGAMSPGPAGDDVALLLAKWSRSLARMALSTEQYRGALGGCGVFQELVLFLDCCRTAAVGAVGLPPTLTFAQRGVRRATRTFVAYATEAGRSAFEHPNTDGWQGAFTRCLLSILQRSTGGITADALKDALEREVSAASSVQRAHVVNGLLSSARLGKRRSLPLLRIDVSRRSGTIRLFDGVGSLLGERAGSSGIWEIAAAPGLYKLQDDGGWSILVEHASQVTCVGL